MEVGFTEIEVTNAELMGLGAYKRYDVGAAALHLGLDENSVRRLIDSTELESIDVGKKVFVLGGHIARWKNRQASSA
jgi:hypothetical protein